VIVNAIDAALTVVFWPVTKLTGYEKCGKCTVRVRWFQFLMLATRPVARVRPISERRVEWALRADPPAPGRLGLVPVDPQEL